MVIMDTFTNLFLKVFEPKNKILKYIILMRHLKVSRISTPFNNFCNIQLMKINEGVYDIKFYYIIYSSSIVDAYINFDSQYFKNASYLSKRYNREEPQKANNKQKSNYPNQFGVFKITSV